MSPVPEQSWHSRNPLRYPSISDNGQLSSIPPPRRLAGNVQRRSGQRQSDRLFRHADALPQLSRAHHGPRRCTRWLLSSGRPARCLRAHPAGRHHVAAAPLFPGQARLLFPGLRLRRLPQPLRRMERHVHIHGRLSSRLPPSSQFQILAQLELLAATHPRPCSSSPSPSSHSPWPRSSSSSVNPSSNG